MNSAQLFLIERMEAFRLTAAEADRMLRKRYGHTEVARLSQSQCQSFARELEAMARKRMARRAKEAERERKLRASIAQQKTRDKRAGV